MLKVLHISDLHFHSKEEDRYHAFEHDGADSSEGIPTAHSYPKSTLDDAISDVAREFLPIDAIVITGDLTCYAKDREFTFAVRAIKRLCAALAVDESKVLMVPGNHDADWEAPKPEERFFGFKQAFENLKGRKPANDLHDEVILTNERESIRLVGVNSASIESKNDQGTGIVGDRLLRNLLRPPDTSQEPPQPTPRISATVLCLHHHILPVAYVEREYYQNRRTSVTLDAKAVLDVCIENHVNLILHGHQHQPILSYYGSINPIEGSKPHPLVWISGAGSAGAERKYLGDVSRRHFQLLTFEADGDSIKCDVHPFVSHPDKEHTFKKHLPVPIKLGGLAHVGRSESCSSEVCSFGSNAIKSIATGKFSESPIDNSDLYLAFLQANRCQDVNRFLRSLNSDARAKGSDPDLSVEAIYDLYGEYDLLVKFRAKNDRPVKSALLPLKDTSGGKLPLLSSTPRILDISEEFYATYASPPTAGEQTKGMKAFIFFKEVRDVATIEHICIDSVRAAGNPCVTLHGLYRAGAGSAVVAEYYLACGGYYVLNSVMTAIEEELEKHSGRGPIKVTLFAQSVTELGVRQTGAVVTP